MSRKHKGYGLNLSASENEFCQPSIVGKLTRANANDYLLWPHKAFGNRSPWQLQSIRCSATVYRIMAKIEVFRRYVKFLALFDRQTGPKINVLHPDSWVEYISTEISKFPKDWGIAPDTRAPTHRSKTGHNSEWIVHFLTWYVQCSSINLFPNYFLQKL